MPDPGRVRVDLGTDLEPLGVLGPVTGLTEPVPTGPASGSARPENGSAPVPMATMLPARTSAAAGVADGAGRLTAAAEIGLGGAMALAGAGAAALGAVTAPEGIGVPVVAGGLAAARMGSELAGEGLRRWRGDEAAARTAQHDDRLPSPPLVPPVLLPPVEGFGADRDAGRGASVVTLPVPEGLRNEGLVVDGPQGAGIVERFGDGEPDVIEQDKQNKHVAGTRTRIPGRSPWTYPDPQALLDAHTGKGMPKGPFLRG